MRKMKKLLGVLLLVLMASFGAPQAFADGNDPGGGIEMPGKTSKAGPGGIEMPGLCDPGGGIEMPGLCTTISIIISTLI